MSAFCIDRLYISMPCERCICRPVIFCGYGIGIFAFGDFLVYLFYGRQGAFAAQMRSREKRGKNFNKNRASARF
jgi:hypothetical protein